MIARSFEQLQFFKKYQYFPPHELRAYQEQKLRKIVRHAYEKVRYYRDLFDRSGLKPHSIQRLDDLYKIPITTKKDLQQLAQNEIVARGTNVETCIQKFTSGSTGHPLKIFLSPWERDYQILLNLHILMENGLSLTDKVAYIINPYRFPNSKHWFQYLGILRREYLSVFDFPQKHVEELQRLKPDIIYGYPSNLTLLANHIHAKEIEGICAKKVFSVAEALEPKARTRIDSVMKVSTCDILGTIELGDIAWQCEKRDGYHISSDAVIVEFIENGKSVRNGREGKIICTNLHNYTMPLIRYAVNDICVPSGRLCSCGRTLPLIESIKGRANDFIVLPDGQLVASCFLVITMQSFNDVAHYRVIQEQPDELTVQIVKGNSYNESTGQRIKKKIEKIVQNMLKVNIAPLQEIKRDPSGKIRTVISKIYNPDNII